MECGWAEMDIMDMWGSKWPTKDGICSISNVLYYMFMSANGQFPEWILYSEPWVALQPGWAHVNCFAARQSLHPTLCSLCSLLAGPRQHDNFFTPNTFFPCAVCGLWWWSRRAWPGHGGQKCKWCILLLARKNVPQYILRAGISTTEYICATSHRVIFSSFNRQEAIKVLVINK